MFGAVLFVLGMITFATLAGTAMTGTIDDLLIAIIGMDVLRAAGQALTVAAMLAVVVGLAWLGHRSGVDRIHIHAPRDGADVGQHIARVTIPHEALGHAAVGAGVRGRTSGIRARVNPDGSGWCEVPRAGVSVAGSLAITRAGEDAAGPAGCSRDQARYRRDLARVPSRYQGQTEREAARLSARHRGSAFGRRVERSLRRSGRFR